MAVVAEKESWQTRVGRFVPAVGLLRTYDRTWLRPDVIAGLTIWAVVVPQAIAYAQIAGMPPQAGLFTAFAGSLAYALFGTSRQLVVSPMSGPAAVSAAIVAPLALGSSERYYDLTSALALFTGIVFLILGWWKAGFISQFIAPSVQAGFMFGLGMTIILGQVPKLLGIPGGEGAFVEQLRDLFGNLDQINWWTAGLGLTGLAAMLLLGRLMPLVPSALVVVLGSIIVTALFDLKDHGVAVVGSIPREIPLPAIPTSIHLSDLGTLFVGALAIALIGYAESNSVAEQFAEEHRYDIKPNQELVALGAANLMSGFFKGFITGGGASQSAANDRAGARTQLSVLILAILCALTSALLMPVFKDLPLAILAAIVISAVTGFINVPALVRIRRLRTESFVMAMVALSGVLIIGILPGLLLGVALTILLLLGFQSRPKNSLLGHLPGTAAYVDVVEHPESEIEPGVMMFRLNSPLMFLNSGWMRSGLKEKLSSAIPPPVLVIIDLQMSPDLDIKGCDTVIKVHRDLQEMGIELRLAAVHAQALKMLRRSGAADAVGEDHIFVNVNRALLDYREQRATGV